MKRRVHLIISGRVQGVFFRANTQEIAQRLDCVGWVKNTIQGNVEVVAEGQEEDLKQLVAWCHHGPDFAHVAHVQEIWEEPKGEFEEFGVRF